MRRTAFVAMLMLGGAAAHAQSPCAYEFTGSPLLVARPPANFGTVPPACPGTDASLVSGAALLVDVGDFYGAVWAGSGVAGRAQVNDWLWFSVAAPGVEYRYVANAVVDASHTGMGAGSLGVHAAALAGPATVAPFARVLIPTENVYRNARRFGGETGASATWSPFRTGELVGGVAIPVLVTQNGAWREVLVQPVVSADAFWHARRWLSIGAGGALRANAAGRDDTLESVEARAGVRVRPWRGAIAEAALAAPRYGRDRTDAAVSLSLGWAW